MGSVHKDPLARLAVLALLGLLVLLDRQARLERRVRRVMTAQRAREGPLLQDQLAHPAYRGPRAAPDRPGVRAHRAR
jgi:hypothetical protein